MNSLLQTALKWLAGGLLLVSIFSPPLLAQYPVTVTGWTGEPQLWAQEVKQDLKKIEEVQTKTVKPSLEELVEMARESKRLSKKSLSETFGH